MSKQEIIDLITEGANLLKVLSIEYVESDGSNEGPRRVEPYSMRDLGTEKEAFFGFDIAKDGIRRFKLTGIQDVKITDKDFTPRNGWDVEF